MTYISIFIALFVLELFYFKLADRFDIIDKPNQRSSHTVVTLRGGGVIFYLGALFYFLFFDYQYSWFFVGLTLMAFVSFLDDVFTLSNKIRLLVHFSSVLLMACQLDLFDMPWYYLFIGFIFAVGVINAYNFMDGINGITACYSLAVGGLLLLVNQQVNFIASDLLIFSMLGVLVFSFFNFRTRAKCFAGDVGSVTIAYILLFALGLLILKTTNPIYLLFLTVYGIDTIWTIIRRIIRKENIFAAHRSHLYQFLGNEAGLNKLWIAASYAVAQFCIGCGVIVFSSKPWPQQLGFAVIVLSSLSVFYLVFKKYIIKKYSIK